MLPWSSSEFALATCVVAATARPTKKGNATGDVWDDVRHLRPNAGEKTEHP